jgi:hypothetical protein
MRAQSLRGPALDLAARRVREPGIVHAAMPITMKTLFPMVAVAGLLTGACGSTSGGPAKTPSTITFQLHNDGISTVAVMVNCQVTFTITSLADPVHTIDLEGPCACDCAQSSCSVCGPCFAGPLEIPMGTMTTESWNAVSVTTQATPAGSCERRTALPDGPYRIDVPVYPSADAATAGTSGWTSSQTFNLPVAGNVVDVALGASP